MSRPPRAILKLGIGMSLALSLGCTHFQKQWKKSGQGHWTAKVLIKDKQNQKSHVANADIYAVKNQKLRLDITAGLGSHIASLVARPKSVRYFLVQSKKFFVGPNQPGVLSPLISVPLSPQQFHNLLFEEPIKKPGWECEKKAGQLQKCESKKNEIIVEWRSQTGAQRKIFIEHPKAEVKLFIRSFSPSFKGKKQLFKLDPPKGFQVYRFQQKN